ncbi:site-2 protease family protein [Methanobacterium alcaliphilum]|uniref:site-2 protease family protein n=1 Tax=Methanobacterium alcaliphilum TaxID=392018 RepID=UPI002009DE45|nr:site-2 protease family protein [Methanobacterium alcaliphilum]MCK9151088.1 site-2 protease family protein [Methanobacterium alcaliphilum]
MNALWFYVIVFVLIWIMALLFRKQLKIEIHGPLLMRKTKRMRGFIDRLAQKKFNIKERHYNWNLFGRNINFKIGPTVSPWRVFLNIGILVAFYYMFNMFYMLLMSLNQLFVAPQASLIIPGVDMPGNPFYIPLSYGIIGLATVIIVHEFAHGILARVEGVRIKSIGVLLLAVLPGAFVEPDEEDVQKSKRSAKLRIFAAGSVANLTLAALAVLVLVGMNTYVVPNTFESDGIQITGLVPKSPASEVLKQGMVIKSINGIKTNDSSTYAEALSTLKIGQNVSIMTSTGTYSIKTEKNPNNSSKPYMGVRSTPNLVIKENVAKTFGDIPFVIPYIVELFFYIYALNFLIGVFNLLPMKPLDGGLMLEELLRYKLSDNLVKPIINTLSIFIIAIIAISIIYGTGRGIMMMF